MLRQCHEFNSFRFALSTDCEDLEEEIGLMFSALHRDTCEGAAEWSIKREPKDEDLKGVDLKDFRSGTRFSLYKNRRHVLTGNAGEILESAEWEVTMALLRRSKGFLQIHSSVVAKGDKALLLVGAPGSGKSTLALALMLSGWQCLSDEVALIQEACLSTAKDADDEAKYTVLHFPRCFHVDDRTLDLIGDVLVPGTPGRFRDGSGKSRLDPSQLKTDWTVPRAEPGQLVFLDASRGVKNRLLSVSKTEAFARLMAQTINLLDYGNAGVQHLTALVNRCPCYQFRGGNIEMAVRSLSDLF